MGVSSLSFGGDGARLPMEPVLDVIDSSSISPLATHAVSTNTSELVLK